jgi:hypothetical protein
MHPSPTARWCCRYRRGQSYPPWPKPGVWSYQHWFQLAELKNGSELIGTRFIHYEQYYGLVAPFMGIAGFTRQLMASLTEQNFDMGSYVTQTAVDLVPGIPGIRRAIGRYYICAFDPLGAISADKACPPGIGV